MKSYFLNSFFKILLVTSMIFSISVFKHQESACGAMDGAEQQEGGEQKLSKKQLNKLAKQQKKQEAKVGKSKLLYQYSCFFQILSTKSL